MMKKITLISVIGFLIISCSNQPTQFNNYDYTSVYFSFQYPVRTLVMGDYILPNRSDENLHFKIGTQMGGVYKNKKKRTVTVQVDENLANNFITASGDTLKALPKKYYNFPNGPKNLSDPVQITIPKGELNGYLNIQLNNKFLNDTSSYNLKYALPLKIIDTSIDSVLGGVPATGITNPKLVNPNDWEVEPKNYVLYAIKYINKLGGNYFHRGQSIVKNLSTNQPIDTVTYREKFTVRDEVWKFNTIGKNKAKVTGVLRRSNIVSPGNFIMILNFNDQNSITVKEANKSKFQISGEGEYVPDGGRFGGEARDAIFLDYQIKTDSTIHNLQDTLVLRDRDISFETFEPQSL